MEEWVKYLFKTSEIIQKLGIGNDWSKEKLHPSLIPALVGKGIKQISCGEDFSIAFGKNRIDF